MGKLNVGKPQRGKKNKKIKAVDPFYHGDRKGARGVGLNQTPKNLDQDVPYKLKRIAFINDKTKNHTIGKKGEIKYTQKFKSTLGQNEDPPTKSEFKRKLDKKVKRQFQKADEKEKIIEKKKTVSEKKKYKQEELEEYIDKLKPEKPYLDSFKFKKEKDETKAKFMRRVEAETNLVVSRAKLLEKHEVSDDKKISIMLHQKKKGNDKKKLRLAEKKKAKLAALKEKKNEKNTGFNALKDTKVEFGEVVHAPPVLSHLPKRAKVNHDKPGMRMPELHEAIKRNMAESISNAAVQRRQPGESLKRKSLSSGMQIITDQRREDFINAYRQMKKTKLK